MLTYKAIECRLQETVQQVIGETQLSGLEVRPCNDPRFGDYQATGLISLAKSRRLNPRQLATEVVSKLDVHEYCETVEVAGPGFLNFRIKRSALAEVLLEALRDDHLFFSRTSSPETVVVDFSSPNVAKPMHVGHIRSTILGDCLARVHRLLGRTVITDNHIGDWGTQFGKLLVGWKRNLDINALKSEPLNEMERLYKTVNQACEADPAALEEARQELVKLQSGDAENLAIWKEMIGLSSIQFETIYKRLGIRFDFSLGESFYNPQLKDVVDRLKNQGLAKESEGAVVVYFENDPLLKGNPAMVQKSDGGFNYTTTDLATLEYRLNQWHPNKIIYVTDGRQQLHFQQLFTIFRRWHPEVQTQLEHVWFGAILGEDGRPFKTRSGETIRLSELLDEAEDRAFKVVSEKNSELSESVRREIARVVGISAVKYADLLPNRQSDYVFSWDKMLSLSGNTAPYLLYAYTRIRSIFRKFEEENHEPYSASRLTAQNLTLSEPQEINLAKHFLNFGLILNAVGDESRPNYLCNYLYELAGKFTSFYESCPVLKAPENERPGRLALCELTGRVLRKGLETLGIETVERM